VTADETSGPKSELDAAVRRATAACAEGVPESPDGVRQGDAEDSEGARRPAARAPFVSGSPFADLLAQPISLRLAGSLGSAVAEVSAQIGFGLDVDPAVADIPVWIHVRGRPAADVLHSVCAAARAPEPTSLDAESGDLGKGPIMRVFLRQLSVESRLELASAFHRQGSHHALSAVRDADFIVRTPELPLRFVFLIAHDGASLMRTTLYGGRSTIRLHAMPGWDGTASEPQGHPTTEERIAALRRFDRARVAGGPARTCLELSAYALAPYTPGAEPPAEAEAWGWEPVGPTGEGGAGRAGPFQTTSP